VFDLDFLRALRIEEMRRILPLLPLGSRVLEVGAGTGEQAKILSEHGFDVVAIDLPASSYSEHRTFPVLDYDGRTIPLSDDTVDVVFSSNVLEHVEDLPRLLGEFKRVLRPGGIGVHVMPTSMWRLATFFTGVPTAVIGSLQLVRDLVWRRPDLSRSAAIRKNAKTVAGAILPVGHGTSFEGLSELVTFSPQRWRRTFARNGFRVEADYPMRLSYTGHMLLGRRLSFPARERLSGYLGSATHIYVVRRDQRSAYLFE
jgi:SAM-dependent methyltransferase